ncbi:hypothetical protein [Cellulomonas fimi]|uniref:Uncharacterized protein n=1 Tax=Cellulomonas fimi TaxID=1708 RepID=A0A7Y0LVS7_CELFI|nr:hypothetical protein [Cellulomonas fimi]NMR18834.1 hypothetical protein [Cellulomonas fimi]
MTDSTAQGTGVALLVLAGLASITLAGCIPLDRTPPIANLVNHRTAPVTLTLTGVEVEPQEFPAKEGDRVLAAERTWIEGKDTCVGDGFIVTDTATGTVLDTSDQPVCGDTTIRVKEDGTVT